jgi:hypothetical protein
MKMFPGRDENVPETGSFYRAPPRPANLKSPAVGIFPLCWRDAAKGMQGFAKA